MCRYFELALGAKKNSENSGVFRGHVNFNSELALVLTCHIENPLVFKSLSKTTENDLLKCCLDIRHQRIKNETEQAKCISVVTTETSDISAQF